MLKKSTPTILKVLGCIVIVYGIHRSYNFINFLFIIMRDESLSRLLTPEFMFWRIYGIVMIVLILMAGKILLIVKKDTVEKFIKYGNIFVIMSTLPLIMNIVRTGYNPGFFYLRLARIIIAYSIMVLILKKNKSIKDYFENIDKKKVKILRRKKSDIENIEATRITEEKLEEKNYDFKNEEIGVSKEDNLEKVETFNKNNDKTIEIEESDTKKYQFKNGLIRSYYENGALKIEENYIDNILDGRAIEYHPNGRIKSIGYYKNGEKIGKWKYYSEKGIALEEEEY